MQLFAKKTNAETSTIEDVRNAITTALGTEEPGTDAFEKLLAELERVEAMITKNPTWKFAPSSDTILTGALSLLMTGIIVRHEQFNVLTSKAVGFLPKLFK